MESAMAPKVSPQLEHPDRGMQSLPAFLRRYLPPKQKVIVCLSSNDCSRTAMEVIATLRSCDAEALVWGEDPRWKTLLRMAFDSRAELIIGSARSILSLAKLAKFKRIPLNIFCAVVVDEDAGDWMLDGIARSLDCRVFCCSDAETPLQEYAANKGVLPVYPDTPPAFAHDMDLRSEMDYLMHWGSVLDCSLYKGDSGLVMEIVCFKGEKLPVLPTCAKMVFRYWNPDTDIPLRMNSAAYMAESH